MVFMTASAWRSNGFIWPEARARSRGADYVTNVASCVFDAGVPWTKPDCDNLAVLGGDSRYRCRKFFFSDPLSQVFIPLFAKKGSNFTFAADDDLVGNTPWHLTRLRDARKKDGQRSAIPEGTGTAAKRAPPTTGSAPAPSAARRPDPPADSAHKTRK